VSVLREFARRAAAFVTRGRRRDDGLADELQFHLQMLEQSLQRQGMDAAAAGREARVRLGGATQIAEAYGDQRTLPWLETFIQDVRYAVRTLGRAPGFALAAMITLALGIGANTAIFTVANTVLLRPLPFADPDRLVSLGDVGADGLPSNIGFQTFADVRDRSRAFEEMAAIRSWQPTLVTTDAERLNAMRVSWNFFAMLGVRPALGRDFRRHDDHPDRYRVLILSDSLWRRRFQADRTVIGRTIRMNDQSFEIVGVMPASFEPLLSSYFYERAELWAVLGYDTNLPYACRSCQHLKAIGRIRRGVTLTQAIADLDRVRSGLAREFPHEYSPGAMSAVRLQQLLSGPVRGGIYVLLAAVGFVLLIACANVANLMLARAMHRTREMAVRAALGASRSRLIRQVLSESLVLSAAGGALGIALALLSLPRIAAMVPVDVPRIDHLIFDRVVMTVAVLLTMTTGVLFGLVPAIRASGASTTGGLTSDARATVTRGSQKARQLLVVTDLALALVLLTGAGLTLKSLARLMQVDPGFNAERVLTLQFSLVGESYRDDSAVRRFIDRTIDEVRTLPGVEAVALAGQIPMGGNGDSFGFHIDGRMRPNPAEDPSAERYSITPDYLRVMQIPLKRGRQFTAADSATSQPVMMVSETTERTLFNGTDPIGQRVRVGGPTSGPWRTIVGVVGDVHHVDLSSAATPQMYLPQSQFTDSFLVLTVRSATADAAALVPSLRAVLREIDPAVAVYAIAPLQQLVSRSFAGRRFVMMLLGSFAALALLLASVGLYGVVSYGVAQRTREVGLRLALGATSADILRLILSSGARTIGAGLTAGLICATVLTHYLQHLLFNVRALDVPTLASAALTLIAVASVAYWLPVRRALRIDPSIALRQD
jgi:putative ABC transport system permease protein